MFLGCQRENFAGLVGRPDQPASGAIGGRSALTLPYDLPHNSFMQAGFFWCSRAAARAAFVVDLALLEVMLGSCWGHVGVMLVSFWYHFGIILVS